MKKIMILIYSLIIVIFLIFISNKLLIKKNINSIYNSLVYIESVNDDTITSGSGFVYKILNNKAYIVTNYHIIHKYNYIYVYDINKKRIKAELISYDVKNDIAILIIDNSLELKEANIVKHINLKILDKIYVVGTPYDIKNMGTITSGKVIDIENIEDLYDFEAIKITAKTDYGNSGSPVLNGKGQIVGMAFLKGTVDDFSYAIPIDFIVNYVDSKIN